MTGRPGGRRPPPPRPPATTAWRALLERGFLGYVTPGDLYTLCFASRTLRSTVLARHPAVGLMLGERTLDFDTGEQAFPLARHVAASLGTTPGALDRLHESLLPAIPPPSATLGGKWRQTINERWKHFGSSRNADLMACYAAWIRRVIAPLVARTGETCLWYSRLPILRCHTPCAAVDAAASSGGGATQQGGKRRGKRKGANRPVDILRNTFVDRTRCIAQLRPGSSFLLSCSAVP